MKFLHTADLHLGKRMNGVKLRGRQRRVLEEIAEIACREQVDGVLIAGDVCENTAGIAMFHTFTAKLISAGIAVYAVNGTCDELPLGMDGVCTCDVFDGTLQSVALQDEHGPVVVSMLPMLPEVQALESVLGSAPLMLGARHVLLAHLPVTDGALLAAFDYAALGGRHNAQLAVRTAVRYSGAPLDFSSLAGKSVTVVELGAAGEVQVREVPLETGN